MKLKGVKWNFGIFTLFFFAMTSLTCRPTFGADTLLRMPFYVVAQRPWDLRSSVSALRILEYEGSIDGGSTPGFQPYRSYLPPLEESGGAFIREIPFVIASGFEDKDFDTHDIEQILFLKGRADVLQGPNLLIFLTRDKKLALMELRKNSGGKLEARLEFLPSRPSKSPISLFSLDYNGPGGSGQSAVVMYDDGTSDLIKFPPVLLGPSLAGIRGQPWYEQYRKVLPFGLLLSFPEYAVASHLDPHASRLHAIQYSSRQSTFLLRKYNWSIDRQPTQTHEIDLDALVRNYQAARHRPQTSISSIRQIMGTGNDVLVLAILNYRAQKDGNHLIRIHYDEKGNAVIRGMVRFPLSRRDGPASIFQFDLAKERAWIATGDSLQIAAINEDMDYFKNSFQLLDRYVLEKYGISLPSGTVFHIHSWLPLSVNPLQQVFEEISAEFSLERKKLEARGFPSLSLESPSRLAFVGWLEATDNLRFRVNDFYREVPRTTPAGAVALERVPEFTSALRSLGFRLQYSSLVPLDDARAQESFDPKILIRLFASAQLYKDFLALGENSRCERILKGI